MTFDQNETVFETREEREELGRAVDPKWMQEGALVGGMGGLSNEHSSLLHPDEYKEMQNPQAIIGNMNQ